MITISLQKIFSAGIDLKYASSLKHPDDRKYLVLEVTSFMGRFLSLSVPTFGVVSGPAYAAGCMFGLSHDYVYVKDKAAFICNEVEIGVPLSTGMTEVLRQKNFKNTSFRDMTLFAKKFDEKEALKHNIVDGIVNDLGPVIEKAQLVAKYG